MSDIDELRNKMEQVTLEMIKLLNTRNEIAKEIGQVKKNLGKRVTDEVREENLRTKVISLCDEIDLDTSIGTKFLNFLLNESVKIQTPMDQTHLTIFLKAKSLEEHGKKIIHMEVGEPDFLPPIQVKNALEKVYDKGFIRYGDAKGLSQFRSALAKKNSETFDVKTVQENILVSPGARFSVYLAISTLLNPGDEIIIIEPAWPAYKDCAFNAGVKVRVIKTTLESKWEPNINQIEEAITPHTKMIVLNYPNNPTGKILPLNVQDEIIELAIKNDLYVLSDEIYSQYSYKEWKSVLSYNYKKSIVTQSFSKSHSMTGFRIGYAIAIAEIINKMSELQALCLTNVSEPIQFVALEALDADISNNANIIKSRLELLTREAKEIGLDFVEPDGSMYLFAKVPKDEFDSGRFANSLLEYGLAVAPGEGFGDYKDFIRLSACRDEKELMDGISILRRYLKE
ncbi:MAG: aminotransferase class I/II-fold pyridoxal phosphate-dependent enzyme [Thaumarchaeota archaeon]|nr:aminotransferase class I/II-fold pyridoxal phosphate-dependent enzyme [Nitrososphaerota archaeon]